MDVVVIGCGIAGSAISWQLQTAGHRVTVFEQAPKIGSAGAGVLLQPNGQNVLKELGVLEELVPNAAKITGLDARHRSGKKLTEMNYADLSPELFGLGILRDYVFELFTNRSINSGVTIREGFHIVDYEQVNNGVYVADSNGSRHGPFHLAVAADGSKSALRHASGLEGKVRDYEDGALWMAAPFDSDTSLLVQVVNTDGRLVGILPVGNNKCSFFWGLTEPEWNEIQARGIEFWHAQVDEFLPEAGAVARKVTSLDDITFATYRTARMKSVVDGRVVFVGDAAHATAPHLGQGLNLALGDALSLTKALAGITGTNPGPALAAYAQDRRSTTRFYSQLTGWIAPFFQTSNLALRVMRNSTLPWMPSVPYLNKHMLLTMSGLKPAWFKPIRPKRAALNS